MSHVFLKLPEKTEMFYTHAIACGSEGARKGSVLGAKISRVSSHMLPKVLEETAMLIRRSIGNACDSVRVN